ncbi:hypothetical protein Mx9_p53 [Myxococcus phage Mx9]|nr:hypothetical protein Mx9_p53 [Myxococcus phage Mx9]
MEGPGAAARPGGAPALRGGCVVTCIKFDVPIKTKSTANLREHWAAKYKRTDAQKSATRRKCPEWQAGPLLVVRLTRVSPRQLDRGDNLNSALKSVRDALAAWLRVDDRTPLVEWLYAQEKGSEPHVRVEVGWGDSPLVTAANTIRAAEALGVTWRPPTPTPDDSRAMAPPPRPPESISKSRPRRARKAPDELRALATPNTYPAKETKR